MYWIAPGAPAYDFPPAQRALTSPNGLLAVGGDLRPERLVVAYSQGIFPWFSEDEPILWWSPNPRMVLFPEKLKISRSLTKNIRNSGFRVTLDTCFAEVIRQCATTLRRDQDGTWITLEMQEAYIELHRLGIAHSAECWRGDELVGGLYGVAVGGVFCGESMFSLASNASKVAFCLLTLQLQQWGYALIDCQIHTQHLASLGAEPILRADYLALLAMLRNAPGRAAPWPSTISAEIVRALSVPSSV